MVRKYFFVTKQGCELLGVKKISKRVLENEKKICTKVLLFFKKIMTNLCFTPGQIILLFVSLFVASVKHKYFNSTFQERHDY